MPSFSKRSEARLMTCHQDLQIVFNEVIKRFDCSILCGHRGFISQNQAYQEGKSQLKYPASKHNKMPSLAVDVVPYPVDWHDHDRFYLFAGYVLGIGDLFYHQGIITHRLRWGGDWDQDTNVKDQHFNDFPHFELIKEG